MLIILSQQLHVEKAVKQALSDRKDKNRQEIVLWIRHVGTSSRGDKIQIPCGDEFCHSQNYQLNESF